MAGGSTHEIVVLIRSNIACISCYWVVGRVSAGEVTSVMS
jgi:hypothetical protein